MSITNIRCNVVCASTTDDTHIHFDGEYLFSQHLVSMPAPCVSKHLYILAPDDLNNSITKGDWFMCYRTGNIFQAETNFINCCNSDQKILASTNPELTYLPNIPIIIQKQFCDLIKNHPKYLLIDVEYQIDWNPHTKALMLSLGDSLDNFPYKPGVKITLPGNYISGQFVKNN